MCGWMGQSCEEERRESQRASGGQVQRGSEGSGKMSGDEGRGDRL